MEFEFQKPGSAPMMGTGWLIQPDVFVTAGHCSYDWAHKLGRATLVKAYIGYSGKGSVQSKDVQFRTVKRIVTTEGWVKTKGQKSFDVSFMQVDRPFTDVNPTRYEQTPATGDLVIGVVGYPGDLKDPTTGEGGAHMYEMFLRTQYNLAEQADTMLEYQIDTFGGKPTQMVCDCITEKTNLGNSGSPVLRQSDLVSIGAHVYGGSLNSASVIGRYGNPYNDYLQAFGMRLGDASLHLVPVDASDIPSTASRKLETTQSRRMVMPQPQESSVHKVPYRLGTVGNPFNGRALNSNKANDGSEEGFMDILKTVGSVLPVFGGPVGALAGFALNAASALAESSAGGAESAADGQTLHEGSMERSILAEATLQALQQGGLSYELEEGIFSDMKDAVMKALPFIRKTAPRVMGAMMEPALKIALDSLHSHNQKASAGAESFDASAGPVFTVPVYSAIIDTPTNRRAEAFLNYVETSLKQNLQESGFDNDAEEGFLDIVKAGVRIGGPLVTKHGLPLLANLLGQVGGAESFSNADTSQTAGQGATADQLATRALVADAALEAVMRLPPQQLQEEGLFDFMAGIIQGIAPIAIKAAPAVANLINPAVGQIVSGMLGQESASTNGAAPDSRSRSRRRPGPSPNLASKRSLASLREGRYGTLNGDKTYVPNLPERGFRAS